MAVFVIFRVQDPERMRNAVQQAFPENFFDLGNNEWLVSAKGTAKEISDRLGITNEPPGTQSRAGNAIVFSMDNYYGRAATNIWEWVKTKVEATDG